MRCRKKKKATKNVDSYIYKKLSFCQKVNKNMAEINVIGHEIELEDELKENTPIIKIGKKKN